MRSSRTFGLTLVLALASCQSGGSQAGKTVPGAGAKLPTTAATGTGLGTSTPTKVAAPQFLRKPAGATTTFSGVVTLDAGYAALHGGGRVLSAPGGQVVGLDGAKVISNDGGTAIAQDGTGLITNDGGTLVNAGGQIVASGGGNVVVPAALISNDGGSLLSNAGGTIIAQGGGNYALTQTANQPAYGSALPAAGMWVSVVDLKTGQAVSLGNDANGTPVRTIYTDAAGKFSVNLPAAVGGNVRVVARAPGHDDARLVLNVLASSRGGAANQVDESQAEVAQYVRYVVADKLYLLASSTPEQVASLFGGSSSAGANSPPSGPEAVTAFALAPLRDIQNVMREVGIDKLPVRRQRELALLATDRLLAEMDLAGIKTDFTNYEPRLATSKAFAGHSAMADLNTVIEKIRLKTAELSARQPDPEAYFNHKPYLIAANVGLAPEARYDIKKASDMGDFVVRAYLSQNDQGLINLVDHVMFDLGLPPEENDRLRVAGLSLTNALVTRLVAGTTVGADGHESSVLDEVKTMMRTAGKAMLAGPPLAPTPSPLPVPLASTPPAPEPPGMVSTIAGQPGGHLLVEGNGNEARFDGPGALALDPRANPPILYLSDKNNAAIRRIKLDSAGQAKVDTVFKDPAHKDNIFGLTVAPDGSLYFSDKIQHSIRHLSLNGAAPVVETLAGTGAGGFLDGPAAGAKFKHPQGLAFTPSGDLLVADVDNSRIRSIAMNDPNHAVTTLMGDGSDYSQDALHAQDALVSAPNMLAFSPDGSLYLSEFFAVTIRAVAAPVDRTSATRFVAGGGPAAGSIDGFSSNAHLGYIYGLAFDASHNRLIASAERSRLRAISPNGDVTTLIGGVGADGNDLTGFVDGAADIARVTRPVGVAVAADGTIYFTDDANNALRKYVPAR